MIEKEAGGYGVIETTKTAKPSVAAAIVSQGKESRSGWACRGRPPWCQVVVMMG